MGEIWKDIEGYEGYYQVSNMGNIKSLARTKRLRNRWGGVNDTQVPEKIISPFMSRGYKRVLLHKDGEKKKFHIHRLVAKAFVSGYFDGADVNHKDETKTNNKAENLEWVTRLQNNTHGTRLKRVAGKLNKPVIQMSTTGEEIARYESVAIAAQKIGIRYTNITMVCRGYHNTAGGYRWKYA